MDAVDKEKQAKNNNKKYKYDIIFGGRTSIFINDIFLKNAGDSG